MNLNLPRYTYAVKTEDIRIDDRKGFRFIPKDADKNHIPSIIFYHGWTSNAARQQFRCQVLASWGYQVFVFDALDHSEDTSMNYDDPNITLTKFWRVIDDSINCFPDHFEYLRQNYDFDPTRFAVIGHSMGGMTVCGLMTLYEYIPCGVAFNGATNWSLINDNFAELFATTTEALRAGRSPLGDVPYYDSMYNPIMQKERLLNRPLLLTNGGKDDVVPLRANLEIADYLKKENSKPVFTHTIYPNQGHFVTDGMLTEGLLFLNRHLKE